MPSLFQIGNYLEIEMTNESKSKHIETVRDGAIGAGIFLKTRKDGSGYHSYTLTRAYKRDGEQDFSYATEFYPRNGEALADVSAKASTRCEELDAALDATSEKTAA